LLLHLLFFIHFNTLKYYFTNLLLFILDVFFLEVCSYRERKRKHIVLEAYTRERKRKHKVSLEPCTHHKKREKTQCSFEGMSCERK